LKKLKILSKNYTEIRNPARYRGKERNEVKINS
jgi:hypothetical protein